MRRRSIVVLCRLGLLILVLQVSALTASAHDCASQQDCEQTTGYIGGVAVIGGIIAILTGLLGNDLGGARPEPGGQPTGAAATEPTTTAGGRRPTRGARPEPAGTEGVPAPEAGPGPADGGIEIPWDELIAADPPDADGDTGIDDLLGEPGSEDGQPGDIPWDDLLGAEPTEEPVDLGTGGGDGLEDPLAGEPAIDELVPPDELYGEEPIEEPTEKPEEEPAGGPKPPGLETAEQVGDIAGQVKDGIDKVKEELEDLPIDDETKEKIVEELDGIGETAETLKDAAEKTQEYIKVLDENLERTGKLGISEPSRDFLGWWRVTIKAVGELTEKFIDGVTAPVTALFGEEGGEKAQELLHDAVPIKEFGEELSKLPTSAAEHVVKAQRRDQGDELVAVAPAGDPFHDALDDLYPRDWDKAKLR